MDKSGGCEKSGFRFSPRPNRAGEISWRHWEEGAFQEAEDEGKLVFLSISAVWCHWCHVMDETTLSDRSVIERLNRDFIPVRVDSDKRPDINRRYNQGGWPTIAFLLPSGRHIAGMTFLPAPQLLRLLDRVHAIYSDNRDAIESDLATLALEEHNLLMSFTNGTQKDLNVVEEVQAVIIGSWDRENGGLGDQPKFPNCEALNFALERYVETGNPELKGLVESTLDAMSAGELIDKTEGGFFRYATAADWSSPHFEKMLGDNAELISLYIKAGSALGRYDYKDVAASTLEYVLSNLADENGRGFYGSQDADEEYYADDVKKRSVVAPPPVDRTIYTDSTALMISALVDCSSALGRPGLIEDARRVADHIWKNGLRDSAGICHYFSFPGYSPRIWGQPADQVNFLSALIDLYEATLDPILLERANTLGDILVKNYRSIFGWISEADVGGKGDGEKKSGVLSDIPVDLPEITGNGRAVKALVKLNILKGDTGFNDAVNGIVGSLSAKARAYGFLAAGFASAVDFIEMGPLEIKISGSVTERKLQDILSATLFVWHPRTVVISRNGSLLDANPEESPPALLCAGRTCYPVYDSSTLGDAVGKALKEEQSRAGARSP
ncbi:MAG: thioredoxin domain-containing protein [Actinobacteria bacterium]|nr:thioredoxin domain-containing protein [Actinomycetota bacterium]